ncbi:MAG: hypothetical protein KC502_12885 [Myxococcales bacterium]|nr:hypothetical protein [Myxococcales bacterium]
MARLRRVPVLRWTLVAVTLVAVGLLVGPISGMAWADAAKGAAAQPPKAAGASIKIDEAPGKGRPTVAAAAAEAAKLTPETIATQAKPKGFRYSILRDVWVDEIAATMLYVKKNKRAKTTKAVPIPKDRKLLDSCIAGGTSADLKRSTIITVKFDPKGVVRPQIVIAKQVKVETLHGKVLDIGGPKLYLALDDHSKRGFAVKTYADWNEVVQNGQATDLKRGAAITVVFDPSGEQGLKITLDKPPSATDEAKKSDGGCGCSATKPRSSHAPVGAALLIVGCAALWLRRRRA